MARRVTQPPTGPVPPQEILVSITDHPEDYPISPLEGSIYVRSNIGDYARDVGEEINNKKFARYQLIDVVQVRTQVTLEGVPI